MEICENIAHTYNSPSPIARRVNGATKQAGLLAQASSPLHPSQFPSGILQGLVFYSGGTAWDSHPLPFSLLYGFQTYNSTCFKY